MTGWAIVTPVKPLGQAKSRLRATLPASVAFLSGPDPLGALEAPDEPGDWHAEVALAMASDTVAAMLAAPRVDRVVVVTDDPVAAAALSALGAVCVPDAPGGGLNPALRHGASVAALLGGSDGRGSRGTAALGADLPALRTADLDAALRAVERLGVRAFVPDAAGTGTTLLAAPGRTPLDPAYGPGSALAHASAGAIDLTAVADGSGVGPSIRRDVDTAADLAAARALGLGPRTAALLAPIGSAFPAGRAAC
ncbi:2-phospho-L-lactate guanylyltransferase [Cryptosporangium aurantiacum]|uniref:Phosphoenolpyruvate guanylyltransferase n=1 Tax=Cryptosporangium aurantiacum TaxID=134849 RepID=A0A1M7HQY0_9ACTN|nr:2-phospho-L-lactate guanylyltransferase [Cryptosporangium aurantiacum]SHM30743.1 2-phospho-L-lactate guanylyltransferase [Cryptosporangium aurantiacum]